MFGEDVDCGSGVYFTAVLTGMSGYEQYAADIVARPYLKIGDVYAYGQTIVRNVYDTALAYQQLGSDSGYVAEIVASKTK